MTLLIGQTEPNCSSIRVVVMNTMAAEITSDTVRAMATIELELPKADRGFFDTAKTN